jgi:hypothetical protein
MHCRNIPAKDEHFRDFPVVADPASADKAAVAFIAKSGERGVLSSRARTGFGGMITVAAVLLVTQLITGVQAFPL